MARVAVGLWRARHLRRGDRLYYVDLLPVANEVADGDELDTRQIGYARKQLGLRSDRGGSDGRTFVIWPGDEEAKALHDRYTPETGHGLPSECSGYSGNEAAMGFPEDSEHSEQNPGHLSLDASVARDGEIEP